MSKNSMLKVQYRRSKPIVLANCISKCYLKHLGRRDRRNGITEDFDKNNKDTMKTPTIAREFSRVDACMAVVSERINSKNNHIYRDTVNRIVKFENSAYEYERLHSRLKNKLKEYDIYIVPNKSISPEEEEMLKAKRINEYDLDPIVLRKRRFDEYQAKLADMRAALKNARSNLEVQYNEIMINVKQLKLLDTYIDTSFIYYKSRINKRISWYWQGLLSKKNTDIPLFCPLEPSCKDLKQIHEDRRREFENRLADLKQTRNKILTLEEL